MVKYIDRKNTHCVKWDGQTASYGEEGLLPLWVADMDFQVPECVIHALDQYIHFGVFGYHFAPDSYYDAFINWEKTYYSIDIKKEWLRFSPGVVSAFHWIVQFMTQPNDSVIVLTPVYYPFLHAVNNNDRKLVCSELINQDGKYSIDFQDFERKIVENQVKLFIHCSPHNPIGRVWTEYELKTLFDICRKHNVFVISDEIHQDLTFGDAKQLNSFTIGDYSDMMIGITAPSKTFNLAACQNSLIIIPDEKLRSHWDNFTTKLRVTNGNVFGYIAAEAAYSQGREWFEEVKSIIYDNYLYMKERFAKELPFVVVSPLEGTYLAWVDMGHYICAEELETFMQKKCGLAFDYGSWFGGNSSSTFIRINLATSKENIRKALDSIISQLA